MRDLRRQFEDKLRYLLPNRYWPIARELRHCGSKVAVQKRFCKFAVAIFVNSPSITLTLGYICIGSRQKIFIGGTTASEHVKNTLNLTKPQTLFLDLLKNRRFLSRSRIRVFTMIQFLRGYQWLGRDLCFENLTLDTVWTNETPHVDRVHSKPMSHRATFDRNAAFRMEFRFDFTLNFAFFAGIGLKWLVWF